MPRIQERDLTFETLQELDSGKVSHLLKRHLANIAADCMNRPGDEAKRKVILEFSAVPIRDPDSGDCESVRMFIEARSKVPTFRTKEYEMRVHASGFLFNQDFPDELDQQPLFGAEPDDDEQRPPATG